jgi:hypothetical protein
MSNFGWLILIHSHKSNMSTELTPKQKEELEMFKLREFKKVKQQ